MVPSEAQQSALDAIKQALVTHRKSGESRHFPDQIRIDVLSLVREGLAVEDIARATGMSPSVIYRWRRQPKKPLRRSAQVLPAPDVIPVSPERGKASMRMLVGDFDVTVAVARLS